MVTEISSNILADTAEAPLVRAFYREWHSASPTVTARTSGSTGAPKSISLPKSDMRISARATNRRFGIGSGSVLLCPLSLDYIAGKMMMVRAIEAGCRILFCHPSNRFLQEPVPREFMRTCGAPAMVPVVPAQVMQILENPSLTDGIHNIIIGGAPISPEVENALTKLPGDTRYFATYGMTETCSHVALRSVGSPEFTAMPGITFSADSRGCLIIDAPEYSFRSLITNDVVDLIDARTFIWRGRFDNVINSGGIKLFPEELERLLAPHLPARFYIAGVAHPKWGMSPALVIEESAGLSDDAIYNICAVHLPRRAMPASICRVASLPRTSTGKIRRLPPSEMIEQQTKHQ